MTSPIDAAFTILKNEDEAHDWQGQEYDTHCPKCGKGIYREDEDDLFAIRETGQCLDCSTSPRYPPDSTEEDSYIPMRFRGHEA
jgi:hypothetical protein